MLQMHTETHGHVEIELKFVYGEKIAVKFPLDIQVLGWETLFLGKWFPVFQRNVVPSSSVIEHFKKNLCVLFLWMLNPQTWRHHSFFWSCCMWTLKGWCYRHIVSSFLY